MGRVTRDREFDSVQYILHAVTGTIVDNESNSLLYCVMFVLILFLVTHAIIRRRLHGTIFLNVGANIVTCIR